MFFGSLIATYLVYQGKSKVGPFPEDVFSIPTTSVSTFVLLMSSMSMVLAYAALTRGSLKGFRIWIASTALMGMTFLAFQVFEFRTFANHEIEIMKTDPAIFEIWPKFVATGNKLSRFDANISGSGAKAELLKGGNDLIHEGKQLDPACRDIEALLSSSQQRVTGQVNFTLRPGNLFIDGVDSPYSLLAATKGVYGEAAGEWSAEDTLGYARILSLSGSLLTQAGTSASED